MNFFLEKFNSNIVFGGIVNLPEDVIRKKEVRRKKCKKAKEKRKKRSKQSQGNYNI